MSATRKAAEVFPVGEFVRDEMEARGWDIGDLVIAMGSETVRQRTVDYLGVELILEVNDKDLLLGDNLARKLARAFGTTAQFWLNLDAAWRAA